MKLYWMDVETTGLDPQVHDLLEIAVAEAELNDPFKINKIYQAVVKIKPSADLDAFIRDMHTKNRLLAECESENAKNLDQVDNELSNLIEWVENKNDRATLAGSSIHFDHSFVKVHLPLTNKKLSHRHYDVSAIKLFCQSMGMPQFKKAEAHRAYDDILESVSHAKECTEWLSKNLK